MGAELDAYMPICYNGIVIETTSRCNAACAMCYQSAAPKGSPQFGKRTLDLDDVKSVLSDATKIENLIPRFHLSGGEAFIDFDGCLELIRHAKAVGFIQITATTNAYWALSPEVATQRCNSLREAGLTTLEISWDHWHKPFINNERISHCLDACFEYGIETNLRLLTTRDHSIGEALNDLQGSAINKATRITSGPVFPTGRAGTTIPADMFYSKGDLDSSCHTFLNLTVNPNGDVSPCCAGFEQQDNISLGNIHKTSIDAIALNMNKNLMVRQIVFSGASTLLSILGPEYKKKLNKCTGMCHLCWSIFNDKEAVSRIETHFERHRLRILNEAINLLRGNTRQKHFHKD